MENKKYLVQKLPGGLNIYKQNDEYGRMHLYAYKGRKEIAHDMFLVTDRVTFDRCLDFFKKRIQFPIRKIKY